MTDLRDERFLPLDVIALQGSETWAMMMPSEARAMLNLWMKAWHQEPAGTLPIDPDVLCRWADCSPWQWDEWQHTVLRGWRVDRAIGRFYHPRLRHLAERWARAATRGAAKPQAIEGPWGARASESPRIDAA
jgi:hypothetical protein